MPVILARLVTTRSLCGEKWCSYTELFDPQCSCTELFVPRALSFGSPLVAADQCQIAQRRGKRKV